MIKAVYILLILFLSIHLNAQVESTKNEGVLFGTEGMPTYPGGNTEMMKFIWKNLKYPSYPKDSIPTNSICIVTFSVNYMGKISDVTIIRSLEKEFDKEMVRVIESMPDWIPISKGKYISPSVFTLPVRVCFRK